MKSNSKIKQIIHKIYEQNYLHCHPSIVIETKKKDSGHLNYKVKADWLLIWSLCLCGSCCQDDVTDLEPPKHEWEEWTFHWHCFQCDLYSSRILGWQFREECVCILNSSDDDHWCSFQSRLPRVTEILQEDQQTHDLRDYCSCHEPRKLHSLQSDVYDDYSCCEEYDSDVQRLKKRKRNCCYSPTSFQRIDTKNQWSWESRSRIRRRFRRRDWQSACLQRPSKQVCLWWQFEKRICCWWSSWIHTWDPIPRHGDPDIRSNSMQWHSIRERYKGWRKWWSWSWGSRVDLPSVEFPVVSKLTSTGTWRQSLQTGILLPNTGIQLEEWG